MNILESIRIAIRAIRVNKVRSILTMLGIIIGVGAVIAMIAIGSGASASVTSKIEGLGSNLLTITAGQSNSGGVRGGMGSAATLKMSDATLLAEKGTYIKAVAPVASTNAQVIYASGNTQTNIYGTTVTYLDVRNTSLSAGRFFTEQEMNQYKRVVVLGPTVVEGLLGTLDYSIIGKTVKINNIPFQVIGVTASEGSSGFSNSDDMILMPITIAQLRLIGSESIRQIFVQAASPDVMTKAQSEITTLLRSAHKLSASDEDDFSTTNQATVLETMQSVTQTLSMLLGGIAAISLIVGGIGIMNIMLVSVTERTREIGIRKAIGAQETDILLQFLIEAVILSVMGGIIGILLGWGGSLGVSKVVGMTTKVSMFSVILAFTFSALIGIVFGVFPAKKASSLNPIDALRYE
ncbi:multidrug ABC transporter substrate-binding protein [Dehalobacter sp. 12DCB1]|uniref:ABC transporter permease n=1 Tax=Dehalobacter sp. 12DCB1 TaxID=2070364 RepID=UPI00104E19A8|nr:ABC transporter permease [Dehalobacter sp. 12DCB1]TCX56392.1 multidrug ABC transporter substrate-binding protein [Dehalobacter sp. 12DCB1]